MIHYGKKTSFCIHIQYKTSHPPTLTVGGGVLCGGGRRGRGTVVPGGQDRPGNS